MNTFKLSSVISFIASIITGLAGFDNIATILLAISVSLAIVYLAADTVIMYIIPSEDYDYTTKQHNHSDNIVHMYNRPSYDTAHRLHS